MPLTTRVDANYAGATMYAWVARLARFLINDLGGAPTGPGWAIVEAYDASQANGSRRRVPTVGAERDMDNAAFSAGANFGWQTNLLGNDDWIVLRSGVGTCGNQFEVMFRVRSATVMDIMMFPLNNFVTHDGGGVNPTWVYDISPPVFPAVSLGSNSLVNPVQFTGWAGAAKYSIVADECMFFCFSDNGATMYWHYHGELDQPHTGGTTIDDRPFVMSIHPEWVGITIVDQRLCRISPVDHATLLSSGSTCQIVYWGGNNVIATGNDTSLLGDWSILPIGVYFDTAAHKHFAGWMRNVYQGNADKGVRGTLASLAYVYIGGYYQNIVAKWDGATAYP